MCKLKRCVFMLSILLFVGCDKKGSTSKNDFKLIDRGSYSSRFIDGYQVFVQNKELMNGYYVVGNKLTKWEEFDLLNGVLNGVYIIYHPNGNKSSLTNYRKGKKHGEEQHFFPSGALSKTINYQSDKRVGTMKAYYESGQVLEESKIENEDIIESISYDNVGVITSQMFIKDGLRITQRILDGKVFSEAISSTYDDNDSMKFYNQDGSLKHHLRMYEENGAQIIIELDVDGNEIKRVDFKKNPEEALKYMELWKS